MAELSFRITPNNFDDRLRAILLSPTGIVTEDVRRRARNVSAEARRLARARSEETSGALPASIRYEVGRGGGGFSVVAQVISDHPRALDIERGTGIFGPRHRRITPTTMRFMKFSSRKFGVVYAASTRGQPGKHFLRDALSAANL